ncbi:MAG: hypothetical protein C3F15_17955 [Holophagae bacterium]|nr:MAG: hypothetical protein C3F15_17955 [Holophagae bacterium]
MSTNTVNGIIFAVIVGGVFGFLGWYFVRYVVGRRRVSSGLRALGIVNFEYLQNADGKKAVQEIMHTQEAWQEEDGESDPPEK